MFIKSGDIVSTIKGEFVIQGEGKKKRTYIAKPFPYSQNDKEVIIIHKEIFKKMGTIVAKNFSEVMNVYSSLKKFYEFVADSDKETFYKELLSQKEHALIIVSTSEKTLKINTMFKNDNYYTMVSYA